MAGNSGAATQPSRPQQLGPRVHTPRIVNHVRLAEGPRAEAGTRELGPRHERRARHGVVWDRDPRTAMRIGNALRRQSHTIHVVGDAAALHRCLRKDEPDVVIVGLDDLSQLPGDIFTGRDVPVIGVTASSDPMIRARFLDAGADDVVPAPLSIPELEARIRAVLARAETVDEVPETLTCGAMTLDPSTSRVKVRGEWVALTALELKLLTFLMRHPSRAFPREALLEKVWGFSMGDTSTVSVHIRRLRLKLEEDPARPVIIRTVWGVGYYLEPPAE